MGMMFQQLREFRKRNAVIQRKFLQQESANHSPRIKFRFLMKAHMQKFMGNCKATVHFFSSCQNRKKQVQT